MKRVNPQLELKLLVTIMDGYGTIKNRALGEAYPEYFGHAAAQEVLTRIHSYMNANRDIPSVRLMAEDPALSGKARAFLKAGMSTSSSRHPARVRKLADLESVLDRLNGHRTQRIFYELYKNTADELVKESPDHTMISSLMEEGLRSIRSRTNSAIFHGGDEETEGKIADSILSDETPTELIRTGFETFDRETGGFGRTNLVFLAANYGGGKSTAIMQLGLNMHSLGYNVLWVPLEMDENEAWERVWSNRADIPHDLIRRRKMTPSQKDIFMKTRDKFRKSSSKNKCRFSTYHPGYVDPWQLSAEIRGYNYDVILIDYINLLKPPAGTPNEERIQLGELAKLLKILAGKRYLNALIIVAAQLNDDNRLKYSRAMAEHANNVIWWRMDDIAREKGWTVVKQDKARASRLYDMVWNFKFDTMTVSDGGMAQAEVEKQVVRGDGRHKGSVEGGEKQQKPNPKRPINSAKGRQRGRGVMPELTSLGGLR